MTNTAARVDLTDDSFANKLGSSQRCFDNAYKFVPNRAFESGIPASYLQIRVADAGFEHANKRFGIGLTEDEGYTTIAGYLLSKAGRLLRPGDRIVDAAGVFSVERVEKRRISRVRFRPSQ